MADAKGIYRTYPPMLLVLSTEKVKMCCRDAEYYYNKYTETIFVKELQEMNAPGMPCFQEIQQHTTGCYDMQIHTLFFLHDPNAWWMPLVHKFLLNPNCMLIHMGIILAMGKNFYRSLKNTSFWIWNVDKGLNFYPLIFKQGSIPYCS